MQFPIVVEWLIVAYFRVESGWYRNSKRLFEKMRTLAGKRKIKLTLVGSCGAGAASIGGIEVFNDMDRYDVNVVGFGCPSLLSPELAEKVRKANHHR
jgi:hypothetical protein